MLIMFKARNYASFKDEVMLDMRAASYVQHPEHIIRMDGKQDDLLKTVAIYGANASGKSNLIRAMYDFGGYVLNQFMSTDRTELEEKSPLPIQQLHSPFLLAQDKDEESEFEIAFVCNGKRYQYGFVFDSESVLEEWYEIENKEVFTRTGTNIVIGKAYEKHIGAYKTVPEDRLYVGILDYVLDKAPRKTVLGGLQGFLLKEYWPFDSISVHTSIKMMIPASRPRLARLAKDEKLRDEIIRYLRAADISIAGLITKTVTYRSKNEIKAKKVKEIYTQHPVYNKEGEQVGTEEFPLEMESMGTLGYLDYLERIIPILKNGGVLIVDELSTHMHPKLTRFIVDLFQSEANDKAQLIFTTHDISFLNHDQFRRDEVVFVDKDERGVSSIYSLSDLKVRDDATFHKEYMQGKYGAIPMINDPE